MDSKITSNLNWGRNSNITSKIFFPKNIQEINKLIKKKNFIFAGNQRSFGDNSINSKSIISTKNLNKILFFNNKSGIISVESGILLSQILKVVSADGWILPVMPGSKYVSVGGIIANNVIGKNSIKNQLKFHILEITLIGQNGKIIKCSKKYNKKIFDLTVGGFGLTGSVISAKLKLKKIKSPLILQKIINFDSYNKFFELIKKVKKFEYNVSWIRYLGKNKISGLLYLGNHDSQTNQTNLPVSYKDKKLNFLYFYLLRAFTQNFFLIKVLNSLFFFHKKYFYKKKIHWNDFFFPQDKYLDFNKIYGKDGFIQFQFCSPEKKLIKILNEIDYYFKKNKLHSTFIILKKIEEKGRYLNFYGKGISVSMDVPVNKGFREFKDFLNKLCLKNKLRMNLSKDIIASHDYIKKLGGYTDFKKDLYNFNKKRKLNSIFSSRLKI
tara:strand:- start:1268 stop:2581 length:1314 start_codon:yes stop_codon:yes gene_type:complete